MHALVALALLATAPAPEALAKAIAEALPLYRQLHGSPELSGQETRTAALLIEKMKSLGYSVTPKLGGVGFIAVLANGPGPTVLVRTDLDALPIQEATQLSYASRTPGVMHACGHDLHMASWFGAASALAKQQTRWKGTLVFLAQPAEEIGTGATNMLKDGVLSKFPRPIAARLTIENGANAMVNDEGLMTRLRPALTQTLGPTALQPVERSMAGEDFGAFGVAGGFPSALLWVGAVDPAAFSASKGVGLPSLHSAQFAPHERAIDTGVTALTTSVLTLLE